MISLLRASEQAPQHAAGVGGDLGPLDLLAHAAVEGAEGGLELGAAGGELGV